MSSTHKSRSSRISASITPSSPDRPRLTSRVRSRASSNRARPWCSAKPIPNWSRSFGRRVARVCCAEDPTSVWPPTNSRSVDGSSDCAHRPPFIRTCSSRCTDAIRPTTPRSPSRPSRRSSPVLCRVRSSISPSRARRCRVVSRSSAINRWSSSTARTIPPGPTCVRACSSKISIRPVEGSSWWVASGAAIRARCSKHSGPTTSIG